MYITKEEGMRSYERADEHSDVASRLDTWDAFAMLRTMKGIVYLMLS